MPEETNWVDVVRAGEWESMNGTVVRLDRRDLDGMITNFESGERRVPLVIGHPKTNDPAFGWVSSLRRMGGVLQAKFSQVHQDVVNLVREGRYKNISVSLFRDKPLRHVGLLGASQPAVPGLQPVAFESGEAGFELEFPREAPEEPKGPSLEERIRQLEAELEEVKKALAREKQLRGETELAYRTYREEQSKDQREVRFERLAASGKVLPGERKSIIELAESMAVARGTVEFAASDGHTEQVSHEEAFWRRLEARAYDHHGLFTEFSEPECMRKGKQQANASDPLKWV